MMLREPISSELKKINPNLVNKEYEALLLELDGLNEMLLNYVDTSADVEERTEYISSFIMFIAEYDYLTKPENLYVTKIVLLNELFKKNQEKTSVLQLVKKEHRFGDQNAAAFKTIIKKELRDIIMYETGIYDRSDERYSVIVKPFIQKFEDFYYSFR